MAHTALLAFGGSLPKAIMRSYENRYNKLLVIGFKEYPCEISCDKVISLGKVGSLFRYLKLNNITDIIMAGYLSRPDIKRLRFDWTGLKTAISSLSYLKKGDDALLRFVISIFKNKGINVLSIADACQELVMPNGALTSIKHSSNQSISIEKAIDILSQTSKYDIGQSIAISGEVVLALEAIEGTDKMIERVQNIPEGKIKALPKPIFIKKKKDNQSNKADLPVFGIKTLDNLIKAGFTGAALQSGSVLLLDSELVINKANQNNFFIYGFNQ